jgi:hypothetical protein|tara:strand:- start:1396 stop:1509 length:114 start_codon:yes stop_codon:yes gene_type:complete
LYGARPVAQVKEDYSAVVTSPADPTRQGNLIADIFTP